MVKKFIYPILLLFILSGCYYSVYSNAYPHLRKIRILAFENRTSEYGLGDKLLNYLNREIREDGRLKLVTAIGKGKDLFLLIEKDFVCLDHTFEDQSDNYPNPNKLC